MDKIARELKDKRISSVGNKMRKDRNKDMYAGGINISVKEAGEYLRFVKEIFVLVEDYFDKKKGRSKFEF
ncbi:MAG: hypothetical protein U9Q85_04120 [Patescibacteria group bacterium]|nr:hypothetical protein [Patescibacteria group bacterium]